jgi:hypothetical protein
MRRVCYTSILRAVQQFGFDHLPIASAWQFERNKTPLWRVGRPRGSARALDGGGLVKSAAVHKTRNLPYFAAGLDLNYLKNFYIYLTPALFAGTEHGESHTIG